MAHEAAPTKTKRLVAIALLVLTAIWSGVFAAQAANRFLTQADPRTGVVGEIGDYQHFYHAAAAITRGENPYRQHVRWYNYLPMWAVMQTPLVPLGPAGAGAAFTALNYLMLLAATWFMSGEVLRRVPILSFGSPESGGDASPGSVKPPARAVDLLARAAVVAVGALLMSDKVRSEFRLGQSDVAIILCFTLSLTCLEKRPVLAGLLLGMIAQFKYQSLVMIPYFVLRRRWTALASTLASSVGLALAGSIVWGWHNNLEYLKLAMGGVGGLLGLSTAVEDGPFVFPLTWERSMSVPSTAARLAEACGWNQGTAIVAVTTALSIAAIALAWRMYAAHGQSLFAGRYGRLDDSTPRGRLLVLLEWCGLIVGALLFSPQTTQRHLFLMLFVVMVALAILLVAARGARRITLGASLAFLWGAMVFPPGGMFPADSPARQAAGVLVLGACLLLFFIVLWIGLGLAQGLDRSSATSPKP